MKVIDFIVLIFIYIFGFYKHWKKEGKKILFINTIMYIYLTFVLYFTLMPIITSIPFMFNHSYNVMNFVPFIDVINTRGDFMRQIILNIAMTVPFGFLFPLIKKENEKFLKTVLYCFLLSLIIEILQPLINRSADITDIITNVVGGIIGFILFLLYKLVITKLELIKKD